MKEINCKSWEEFESNVSDIFQEHKRMIETRPCTSGLLFRGQESADWKLETTLERFAKSNFEVEKYDDIIKAVRPAVTSLTEKTWAQKKDNSGKENLFNPPPEYEFMVYLRHHGFPSPLLDWSQSPYVAAFFAFRSKQNTASENVAIYSYRYVYFFGEEMDNKGLLVPVGPYIVTHKRHYTQQCEYTICKKRVEKELVYCPHEEAFQRNTQGQYELTKFVLPRSERTKVLEKLNFMNVNAYSLFGNEEGLMETLAYQEIEKRFP